MTCRRLGPPLRRRRPRSGSSPRRRSRSRPSTSRSVMLRAGIEALAPVLAGTPPAVTCHDSAVVNALVVDALAHDLVGESRTAEDDVERALDLAEQEASIFPFLITPARDLLERHPRHRTHHAALLASILDVLGGSALPARRFEDAELRGAHRERDARPSPPPEQPLRPGDRGRSLPFDEHREDAHAAHLREARCPQADGCGRMGEGAGTARTVDAEPPLGTIARTFGGCGLIRHLATLSAMDDQAERPGCRSSVRRLLERRVAERLSRAACPAAKPPRRSHRSGARPGRTPRRDRPDRVARARADRDPSGQVGTQRTPWGRPPDRWGRGRRRIER